MSRMRTRHLPLLSLLCFPALAAAQALPESPSAAARVEMIAEIREKALAFNESLPDFICTQLTRRYFAPAKGAADPAWSLRDSLTIQLTYFGKKESYRVVQVNDRPTSKSLGQVGGWTAPCGFGSMLQGVFAAKSDAKFEWQGWETWNGRLVAALTYRLDRAHSAFNSNGRTLFHRTQANWPARGLVFADAQIRQVLRLTVDSVDMPPESPTSEVHIMLEYANHKIGDRDFLLPSHSVSLITFKNQIGRLDTQFTAYRKFSADAEVRYGAEAEKPPSRAPAK